MSDLTIENLTKIINLSWYKDFGIEVVFSNGMCEEYICDERTDRICAITYAFRDTYKSHWKAMKQLLSKVEKIELFNSELFMEFLEDYPTKESIELSKLIFDEIYSFKKIKAGQAVERINIDKFLLKLCTIPDNYLDIVLHQYITQLGDKNLKLIYQQRIPWTITHITEYHEIDAYHEEVIAPADDVHFRARFAFAIVPEKAKQFKGERNYEEISYISPATPQNRRTNDPKESILTCRWELSDEDENGRKIGDDYLRLIVYTGDNVPNKNTPFVPIRPADIQKIYDRLKEKEAKNAITSV